MRVTHLMHRTLLPWFLLAATFLATPTIAHRSGCHAWHSCPSDHGTYVCGDTGHCSQCPDNEYCEGGALRHDQASPAPFTSQRSSPTSQDSMRADVPPGPTSTKPAPLTQWRQLTRGMSRAQVRKLLGEPARIDGGPFENWYYSSRARVTFYNGAVDSWREP
jgi:hypothetical protein